MINVGIIGYGKMGQIRHKVISTIPDAEVICYYDPIIINEKIFKVEKPEQIINNPEVDAIFICTPNFLNKKLTIAILGIGYADGVSRILSNKGFVYYKNLRFKIIGRVSMDSITIDISEPILSKFKQCRIKLKVSNIQ